jgi:putative ferrous iron transport protein C
MILSDLRSYLKGQKRVALKDMETRFNIDADALRGMLAKWISKGYVKKLPSGAVCSTGCCKCDPALSELYEWIER